MKFGVLDQSERGCGEAWASLQIDVPLDLEIVWGRECGEVDELGKDNVEEDCGCDADSS